MVIAELLNGAIRNFTPSDTFPNCNKGYPLGAYWLWLVPRISFIFVVDTKDSWVITCKVQILISQLVIGENKRGEYEKLRLMALEQGMRRVEVEVFTRQIR